MTKFDKIKRRINKMHMTHGVVLIDSSSIYIDPHIEIGKGTTVWPNTYIRGDVNIGENCEIGPNTIIQESKIGDRCKIWMSVLDGAIVDDDVNIGPFSHLRKGVRLGKGAQIGSFVEVKNSVLGFGVKVGHYSYIGDATIGEYTNIGAGTLTCNYDGEKKHSTEIGKYAFIGADTKLVAPLKIGDGARTGAGAIVTKDVPDDTLVVGMPARAIRKLEKRKNK
ncbi:MAG TPA: DapH/DapD/GlmU-related protein [Anaerolineales bacterium]|nr:DapH/DapD/GlmU-related protein [Anaerolineales bacterium]